jgi:asparagine synthase (glutamine-hydrolysing)
MCGITGFVGSALARSAADARLARMCGAIVHRGPDDEGRFVAPGVALGMRRLSIIDVAGGHQPISNEDGQVTVVFNGEIYNHRQLRSRLIARGHTLRTSSDTECLVHLYEDEGPAMLRHLRGMFTFAIWDARSQQLFVARDRLGIKPLYYWDAGGEFAFGSELRTLLTLPEFPRALDARALAGYLTFGYVPEPHAIFAAAKKLLPGHAMTWSRAEGLAIRKYWSPVRPQVDGRDTTELVSETRRLIEDAVRCHLESEVPLGAFLSGGIDSSTVVAHMARISDRQVSTFSIGFDSPEHNEAPHAAAVARAIGTRHTELIVKPDADALTEDLVRLFDEPFADSSALPTLLVCQLARQHVTVALSGDGGDELFGGYTRYQTVLGRRSIDSAPVRAGLRSLVRALPHAMPWRNRLLDFTRSAAGRYASTVALALDPAEGGVAKAAVSELAGAPEEQMAAWFEQVGDRDLSTQLMLVDLQSYLPGDILTKVDRTSMAVSLEARVPLLDHELAEFAIGVPASAKIRGGEGKWLLREAIRGIVPDIVLSHPKQGFAVPIDAWLRRELRYHLDRIQGGQSPIHEWVDAAATGRVIREHLSGRRNHKGLVWRLIVLDLWMRALARGELALPTSPNAHAQALVERAQPA